VRVAPSTRNTNANSGPAIAPQARSVFSSPAYSLAAPWLIASRPPACATRTSAPPQPSTKRPGGRLAGAVESERDNDVVRIVGGSGKLVAAHARLLPLAREAIEGFLPGLEVADRVFDLKTMHALCSFPHAPHRSACTHSIKGAGIARLRRTSLPRNRVNKGKRKGRGSYCARPAVRFNLNLLVD
jgi:hypothetical protein